MDAPLACPIGHPLALRDNMESYLRDGVIQERGQDIVFIDTPFEKLCPPCGKYYTYPPDHFRSSCMRE